MRRWLLAAVLLGGAVPAHADSPFSSSPSGVASAGGTYNGAVTFSAAGSGVTVNNNATVKGVLLMGTATYAGEIAHFNGAAASGRQLRWQTASTARVYLGMDNAAESGNNVGADACFTMFNDAGSSLGWSDCFFRATGGLVSTSGYTFAGDTSLGTQGKVGTWFSQTFSGNQSAAGTAPLNTFTINDSVTRTSDVATSLATTGINIVHNITAGANGGRAGLNYTLALNASPADGLDQFYTAVTPAFRSAFNAGGVDTTTRGAAGRGFALNPTVNLQSGATNYFEANPQENNCSIASGASAALRWCLALATLGAGVNQGAVSDAALAIYGSGAAFRKGITFGTEVGAFPIDPNGTIVGVQLSASNTGDNAKFGDDYLQAAFPLVTTSTNGAAFRTFGWAVDGGGSQFIGRFSIAPSSTALTIDSNVSIGDKSAAPTIDAGTTPHNWEPLDLADDGHNGLIAVTAAVAQAATVANGGTGGTPGACTVTGTTGGPTAAQFSGTVSAGGVLTGALTVAVAGSYTTPITNDEFEPVTGCGLTGAQVSVDLKPTVIGWFTDSNSIKHTSWYPSLTPPSNPITVSAFTQSRGTGLTVDETWLSTALPVALAASGGGVKMGGASTSGIVATLTNSAGACTHTPGASSETVSCSSDIKFKTDIHRAPFFSGWLWDLPVREFTLRSTGKRVIGTVAQDLLRVHPEMVHANYERDDAGKVDTYLSVDEPNVWRMVKAIQELQAFAVAVCALALLSAAWHLCHWHRHHRGRRSLRAEIEALHARIVALEGR